jgi:hypothetical protein
LCSGNEQHLIGVVTEPGGGHFDWSEKQARFMALYIKKACQYRIAGKGPLKKLDPRSGWLTDASGMSPDHYQPAPYNKYKGDPKKPIGFLTKKRPELL